ncbi:MAG: hypothetical protein KDI79_15165 [Anaerolineae bacterium]|nr:hypothetical protein [Anaerolineae bacterium]
MLKNKFPPLSYEALLPSLKSLQNYAKLTGKVRRALTPRQKHWSHISLRATATGLTTGPIPAGSVTFELLLDFTIHQLVITTNRGERISRPLRGQSAAAFYEETLAALAGLGLTLDIDRTLFTDDTPGAYNMTQVETYWQALSQVDAVLKQFKGELRQETSDVQLWPHHFDLAVLWFSGRLVPDTDPADEENADEQMNFGFAPGDAALPQPYFYITAYPMPAGLTDMALPSEGAWHTQAFTGALLLYETLVDADNPAEKLLTFLRSVQQAGASLMRS